MALTNTYYLARLMRSARPEDRAMVERVGVVFPNQAAWGTHLNIAGAPSRGTRRTRRRR